MIRCIDNLLCKLCTQLYGYDVCNSTDSVLYCDCLHILGMLLLSRYMEVIKTQLNSEKENNNTGLGAIGTKHTGT